MTRIISHLALYFLMSFLAVGLVFAQADVPVTETVTLEDLGVSEPGILPTNPFYFIKEWGRGVRSFFTFNRIAKAELELRIANEKAAELKKVQETRPDDIRGLDKAMLNYQKSQVRLRIKFEAIKGTSQNPNVDQLLEKLADRIVKHEKLMDEIAKKHEDRQEFQDLVDGVKEKIEEAAVEAAKKDDPEKFASRIEKALIETRGSKLKHIRSVEILDRLEQKASEDLRLSLVKVREELSDKFIKDVEEFLNKEGVEKTRKAILQLPGKADRRSVFLEEIKERAKPRVASVLRKANEDLDEKIRDEKNIIEKAKTQVRHATEKVQKLEAVLVEKSDVVAGVRSALVRAKDNLRRAKTVLEEEKYGEAYGQARAAEVIARNALGKLDRVSLEERVMQKKERMEKEEIMKREENMESKALELKSNLRTESISDRTDRKTDDSQTLCIQQHDPVCGTNGKTYSNACFAKVAGVEVKHRGKCEEVKKETSDQIGTIELFKIDSIRIKPLEEPKLEPVAEPKLEPVMESKLEPVLKREPQNVSVAITFQGKFDPEVVKIKKGDKVTWVNKGKRQVWPASTFHPTHTSYPDSNIRKCGTDDAGKIFDACRALENGESYSFTFEKVGRWNYHDHWSSVIRGVVEVVE